MSARARARAGTGPGPGKKPSPEKDGKKQKGRRERKERKERERDIAVNRRARHDYEFVEKLEAGLVLLGTEVKSAREGRVNLKDGYAAPRDGELYLLQVHISPYSHGSYDNHDALRPRKLLVHRRELRRLIGKITERGLTLVPTRMYFKNGRAKVELALARGKKRHDRRAAARERDIERDVQAALKERLR
jgi:SsrA-binding protein